MARARKLAIRGVTLIGVLLTVLMLVVATEEAILTFFVVRTT